MTDKRSFPSNLLRSLKGNHIRNKRKGLYTYMMKASLKILAVYLVFIIPLILILQRLVDVSHVFAFLTENLSDAFIFVVFTLSESFLGMIPPDLFVIWSGKFNSPALMLALFGILSYAGGAISYLIGHWIAGMPKVKAYTERALEKYIILVRKWGGAFIIIAALFPFSPYSMVIIAVSLLRYPFRLYLLFGISRIVRFLIQGILYLDILKIDSFFSSLI